MFPEKLKLDIALIDSRPETALSTYKIFNNLPGVRNIFVYVSPSAVYDDIGQDSINSVLLNFNNFGSEVSLEFIEKLRVKFPHVPICLVAEKFELEQSPDASDELPGASDEWRGRLKHYYRFASNYPPETLRENAEKIVFKLSNYLAKANTKAAKSVAMGTSWSAFSISMIIGAVVFTITENLPGGLNGGDGFIIGFTSSFILLVLLILLLERRKDNARNLPHTMESRVIQCSECKSSLLVESIVVPISKSEGVKGIIKVYPLEG